MQKRAFVQNFFPQKYAFVQNFSVIHRSQSMICLKFCPAEPVSRRIDGDRCHKSIRLIIIDKDSLALTGSKNNMVITDMVFFQELQRVTFFPLAACRQKDNDIIRRNARKKFFRSRKKLVFSKNIRSIMYHNSSGL